MNKEQIEEMKKRQGYKAVLTEKNKNYFYVHTVSNESFHQILAVSSVDHNGVNRNFYPFKLAVLTKDYYIPKNLNAKLLGTELVSLMSRIIEQEKT
jgi:hypothetical protein